jgi:hypothetical protein
MPFAVFQAAVKESRRQWWDTEAATTESKSALQVDNGTEIGADHVPLCVNDEWDMDSSDTQRLFSIAIDTYCLKRNPVLAEYCKNFPDRIPQADSGRPLVPILVEFFVTGSWRSLLDGASNAVMSHKTQATLWSDGTSDDKMNELIDRLFASLTRRRKNARKRSTLDMKNNSLDITALQESMKEICGDSLSSDTVIKQMMNMINVDEDGCISKASLKKALNKCKQGESLADIAKRSSTASNMTSSRSGRSTGSRSTPSSTNAADGRRSQGSQNGTKESMGLFQRVMRRFR